MTGDEENIYVPHLPPSAQWPVPDGAKTLPKMHGETYFTYDPSEIWPESPEATHPVPEHNQEAATDEWSGDAG